jgi:hypothetical protein
MRTAPCGLGWREGAYAYAGAGPQDWIDPLGLLTLPNDPQQLPDGWERDPHHRDPHGSRWRHPQSGWVLDFHEGRPGQPRWRAKNHWHVVEGPEDCDPDDHLEPGTRIPDPPEGPTDAPYEPFFDHPPIFIFPIFPPLPWPPWLAPAPPLIPGPLGA